MARIIIYSIKLLLLLVTSSNCLSQTETFDIVTYTAPKDPIGIGWKKDAKKNVVNYTNINEATGTFCVITMYASSPGSGDAKKDFNNKWKELVVTPYAAEAPQKTETQKAGDGWTVVTGAAPVKFNGNDVFILLTVVSGFGKTVSIRCSMNDQSYTAQIDALFEKNKISIELG